MSSHPFMLNPERFKQKAVFGLLILLIFAATVSAANGQSFSITASPLQPASVDAGSSALSSIDLTATGGFSSPVDFTCTITSNQVSTNAPVCLISPSSETPPANGPSVTITTTGATPAGTYQVTITGTSGSGSSAITSTATLYLNVADLTEDYTITVLPTTAVPSPVIAGSVATTMVTVSPIGTYTGSVTLSCLSVTPVVTGAPVCSFSPATVNVTSGVPPTSTLTLTTFGTTTTAKSSGRRILPALGLAIPALCLIGFGAMGSRKRRLLGIFMLVAIAIGLLFLPACSSSSSTTTSNPTNQVTPNNTYTFTLSGADVNGTGPSSTTAATVTLQVSSS